MNQECVVGFTPHAGEVEDRDFGVFYGLKAVFCFYLMGAALFGGLYLGFIQL